LAQEHSDKQSHKKEHHEDAHKENSHKAHKKDALKKSIGIINRYGWILLLILVAFAAIWYRAYPIYLPSTDDWAEKTVNDFYKEQISNQINAQYPNLPEQNKAQLIEAEYLKLKETQSETIDTQIEETSQRYKEELQDDEGQTYLLAIDPYVWYGYSRNYLNNGHYGDEIIDGESWYMLRNGRQGKKAALSMLPFLTVINYKVMNLFTEASVMAAAFYMPLILLTLAAIASFFAGRRIGGNIGGVMAGLIVGVHSALLNRTAAGFSDTDNLIAFGELITVAFFILALSEKKTVMRWVYTIVTGLSMAFFAASHYSWWHIFDFIFGAMVIWILYNAWEHRDKIKKPLEILKAKTVLDPIKTLAGFMVSTWAFYTIIFAPMIGQKISVAIKMIIMLPFTGPLAFINIKQVGISKIWPNVMTTVAELNRIPLSSIIGQLGGNLLFAMSIVGIVYLLLRKDEGKRKHIVFGAFLVLWYIGGFYASQTSVRFVSLLVPAFALGMAAFAHLSYNKISEWVYKGIKIDTTITKAVIVILLILVVIVPLTRSAEATAKSEVPSMNDAWYNALLKINADSDDAIITSWWDFGHWFVAVAQRRVTFDGGDQSQRIHWVGRVLKEDNETRAVGILRMLNCAQQEAPHTLSEMLGGGVYNDVKAVDILYSVFALDTKDAAREYVRNGLSKEQAKEMLEMTHCNDLIKQYFITSEDMVGKAGVWAHFGSWDFTKAAMFNQVKGKNSDEGKDILTKQFNLTQEDAEKIYYEIQTNDGDQWISPWPSYVAGPRGCSRENNTLNCKQAIQSQVFDIIIDLETMEGYIVQSKNKVAPNSIVYVINDTVKEKIQDGEKAGFSVILIPSGDTFRAALSAPEIANSMFTRMFYLEGHGLKHFKRFDDRQSIVGGGRIITWTVDWEEQEPTTHYIYDTKSDETTESDDENAAKEPEGEANTTENRTG